MQWLFSQVKRPLDDNFNQADLISSVRFNNDGTLLAVGDKGGRIVIFKKSPKEKKNAKSKTSDFNKHPSQYEFYCTFQSHFSEFDYLKSIDIEEKINCIRWLPDFNVSHSFLCTNDKTIKLWKISEKFQKFYSKSDTENQKPSTNYLSLPQLQHTTPKTCADLKKVYNNAHAYYINSIALCADQATFLSADDLRINLWHYQCTNECFTIVDIKPENLENLSELITCVDLHPHDSHTFAYSTSKASIRLCDMRARALCDNQYKDLHDCTDAASRSFFSEIISSITHVSFSPSGTFLLSRDYFNLKIWDVRMEGKVLETYPVHEHLRSRLSSLYEEQYIFDQFQAGWSSHDRYVSTGSYNNFICLYDRETNRQANFECTPLKPLQSLSARRVVPRGKRPKKDDICVDNLNLKNRVLYGDWHPAEPLLTVASGTHLYFLSSKFL